MIYLFENPDNSASIVFDETTLTDAHKAKGVAVEELPTPQTPEGKQAILKVNKSTSEVWYEYVDAPINEVTEIENLKQAVLDLTELVLMG
jgi:hypothetical protein